MGYESCDNGNIGGCNSLCNGVVANWTCSGGSPTTSTTCSCSPGYVQFGKVCETVCGDGIVGGSETCDD